MLPSLEEYHRPKTVSAALRLLARGTIHTVPLAGGTSLVPSRNASVRAVVDLGALDMATAEWQASPIRLGAMTTLQTIVSEPAARTFAHGVLVEAARLCATRNIRNVATIGGTIVAGGPTCDLLVAWLALGAQVTVRKARRRVVALEDLLDAPDEFLDMGIITHMSLPVRTTSCGAALVRVARTPIDRAIVNAAVSIASDGPVCRSVRIAIGGVAARPIRALSVESELEEQEWDEVRAARVVKHWTASFALPSDFRASDQYRREMAEIVVQRALAQAWARARGAS